MACQAIICLSILQLEVLGVCVELPFTSSLWLLAVVL